MHDIDAYWKDAFPLIEGWVDNRLCDYLKLVDGIQRDLAVGGQILEIGVYHGKLLLALAHLASPGDKITAVDVFEDQTKNIDGAGVGSIEYLEKNIREYGPNDLDYHLEKADSIALNIADKMKIIDTRGPFRIVSVDGCHTCDHTLNDLLTAQDWIVPGGVIILDDVFQPHWPGVTEAVGMLYGRCAPRVKPFLYCFHKLFFVGHGWHSEFLKACLEHSKERPDARLVQMFGSNVLAIYP